MVHVCEKATNTGERGRGWRKGEKRGKGKRTRIERRERGQFHRRIVTKLLAPALFVPPIRCNPPFNFHYRDLFLAPLGQSAPTARTNGIFTRRSRRVSIPPVFDWSARLLRGAGFQEQAIFYSFSLGLSLSLFFFFCFFVFARVEPVFELTKRKGMKNRGVEGCIYSKEPVNPTRARTCVVWWNVIGQVDILKMGESVSSVFVVDYLYLWTLWGYN